MPAACGDAGGRRGAQMGTFDVSHPDVREFIRAKREDGRLRQFNLSLLITDGFMQAVKDDADWPLVFPIHIKEQHEIDLTDADKVVWRDWPTSKHYVVRDDGLVACKVYSHIRARHLWDMIMVSTYDYAEPGFILIDRVNEMNNNWWCENIRATNPCGEQPLPPYGCCDLGPIILTRFVRHPFGFAGVPSFDFEAFEKTVAIQVRALDNVTAAREATVVALTVPAAHQLDTLATVREALQGKILIDVTVPLVPVISTEVLALVLRLLPAPTVPVLPLVRVLALLSEVPGATVKSAAWTAATPAGAS